MAIHLDGIGVRDTVLLERGPDIGGTWRDNVYPGAACDISSHLYSYSFDLNPDWSHDRARQPEIQAYLQGVVDRHGLRDRIRFGCTATDASWSEETGRWTVRCADGHVVSARFLVSAIGGLKDPRYPEIPGIDRFEGPALHTARWDPSVDLAGKRVGCIGTGASAIQLVPELAAQAGALTVFQRTPPWVIHRPNHPIGPWRQALFRRSTTAMKLYRLALYLRHEAFYFALFRSDNAVARLLRRYAAWDLAQQVPDEALRAAVTPDYRLGCKRILFSDRYYTALQSERAAVETTAITEIVPGGVVLADGRKVDLDVLVFCTGFTVDDPLGRLTVRGADGRSLRERWQGRPQAWLGVTLDGFPNGFLLSGPNTGLGHNSVIVMFEAQMRYVADAIAQVRAAGPSARIELLPGRAAAFVDEVDARHTDQVWASGCDSWYRSGGVNFTLWPGSTLEYRKRLQRFDAENYRIRAPAP